MDDRLDKVIERALEEQVDDDQDERRHLTVATLAVAVALVDVADEIAALRKAIKGAG